MMVCYIFIFHTSSTMVCLDLDGLLFELLLYQAVIWFLARWSCTYLMPYEESKGNIGTPDNCKEGQHESKLSKKMLLNVFGEHERGKFVLDAIVRIATATLVSYPGEKNLLV